MKISGTVEEIEYKTGGYEKKIITLKPTHNQTAFVEVSGENMELINNIKVNDEIVVDVTYEGSISKKNGLKYNNIVVKKIEKICHNENP